ncbi:MAG: PD-(D/E)XK nuclease family protein [Clostridia bacterium]|nr:PD-(D/E)XK nuclease family protein [Clostridia bacterium]
MTNEQAKKYLLALRDKLNEIKYTENRGINVFKATGMQTQEIKHSAFLAWLLNPSNPHGLDSEPLKKFLERLFNYPNEKNAVLSNVAILKNSGIDKIEDLNNFAEDTELIVETEKTLNGTDSRMDLFFQSQKTKTVLVIENKVFASTHDNQLSRYEEKLKDFCGWKKIFIYLTPNGDIPTEDGEYKNKWCVFSYKAVLLIIGELMKTLPKSKDAAKLKLLLEDYSELVETDILKENKELRDLCKLIRREHKEALEILMNYTDNADDIMSYCAEWARKSFDGATVLKEIKRNFEFCTTAIKSYFKRHGEDILNGNGSAKLCVSFGYNETVGAGISLQKSKDECWSAAQEIIIRTYAPEKITADRYVSLNGFTAVIASANDRELDFENIKPSIEEKLTRFGERIKVIEKALLQL